MGGRALLQPDMVRDFRQGAFALLLEPGIRHRNFRCRESEATVRQVLAGSYAWDEEVAMGEKSGVFTEWSCLQLGVFG